MPQIIQQRRGTASQWTTSNPILRDGEFGFETDTLKFKLGNGVTAWNSLAYGGPRGFFPKEAALEIAWNEDYPSNFSELTYSGAVLDKVEIWTDASKTTKLFTKQLTYSSGDLTQVVITDHISTKTMTKTIIYQAGKPKTVTRVSS